MTNFQLSDLIKDLVIDEAFTKTRERLATFAADEVAIQKISLAFGDSFNTDKVKYLLDQWKSGNFANVPTIELLPGTEINHANAAFSDQTNTIYLSQEYVNQNSKNSEAIANVLLEEIGHFVDSQINMSDSPGDEGAIFAALVQGIQLSESALQQLQREDDTTFVELHGQVIQLEQAENGLDGRAGVPYIDNPLLVNKIAEAGKDIPLIGGFIGYLGGDIPLEGWGWVWVDPNQKYQNVVGVVKTRIGGENDDELRVGTSNASEEGKPGSFITHSDFPAVHDSHDQNTIIQVDPGYESLLSKLNEPGQLEIEWETGIRPDEHAGDGVNPIFPKWVWPSPGDRIWANGSWIYDTGHGETGYNSSDGTFVNDGVLRFRSEIHPPRAFATMRDQVIQTPDTGSVPVHVTATDLYIHGDGGYASEILNGGQELLITGGHAQRFTPIDENFNFQIQLPDKPFDTAIFTRSITDAQGNTFSGVEPQVSNLHFDEAQGKWVVDVTVPLANTGITPDQVYARHINVGWAYPTNDLHHLQITLTKMILHEDMDSDPGDGELTFSWLNVDKAGSNAWQRLSDFDIPTRDYQGVKIPIFGGYFPGFEPHDNILESYDDDDPGLLRLGRGNGNLNFSGPRLDFYVANGQPVTIRTHSYDQDGSDDLFGNHNSIFTQIPSYINAVVLGAGDNDPYNTLETYLQAPNYNSGEFRIANPENQYELVFRIDDIPLLPEEINQAPIALINVPQIIEEGQSTLLSSVGSYDPDGSVHDIQWDFNYDGQHFDQSTIDSTDVSPSFFAADGSLSQTIALRVIDNLGVPTLATSTIAITNMPPAALVSGDIIGVPGQTRSFTLFATDPSPVDTAAGFTFFVDFGDGTSQIVSPEQPLSISHIYSAEGTNTLKITATDKDGGISEVVTHTIEVKAAAIIPDPDDPTQTDLFVGGTLGNDQINVNQQGENSTYTVSINGQSKGVFSPNRRIVVFGQDGKDNINVVNSRLFVEVYGGNGDDYLEGESGKALLDGGDGVDTISYLSAPNLVSVNLGANEVTDAFGNHQVLRNIENITGSKFNDRLVGDSSENNLKGLAGKDFLDGGDGSDTASYRDSAAGVSVNLTTSVGTGGDAEGDTLQSIENLEGSALKDHLTGNAFNNTLAGLAENDVLAGEAGTDTLYGDEGDDTLIGGAGADLLDGEDGSDTASYITSPSRVVVNLATGQALGGDAENDNLQSIENLEGSDYSDSLTGDKARNILDGGLSDDAMFGAAGNDIYVVDNVADKITESANQGRDTVKSSITYTLGENLENLILTGKEPISGMGNNLENIILGNDAGNFLFGDAGKDILSGGNGDDTLDGGVMIDVMAGGLGNDTYIVDSTADQTIESENEGIDKVNASVSYVLSNNVENLDLVGSAAINGVGNALGNIINGNDVVNYIYAGDGADLINGASGDDYIYGEGGNDSIAGGNGSDNLNGGLGNDIISGNKGRDWLVGDLGNDELIGGADADHLVGGTGDDELVGGVGKDWLTGGAGADQFTFRSRKDGADIITDFRISDGDRISVSAKGFGKKLKIGKLSTDQFTLGSAAATASDRFIYDSSTGHLFFDADGNGKIGQIQLATLPKGLSLTNQNIVVTI